MSNIGLMAKFYRDDKKHIIRYIKKKYASKPAQNVSPNKAKGDI